ncbi:hypothetical protein Pfra02_18860 [Pseudomonas fragi]|nr:hypothetical protein Pfra02_18860 [Pseudomonas fragi]
MVLEAHDQAVHRKVIHPGRMYTLKRGRMFDAVGADQARSWQRQRTVLAAFTQPGQLMLAIDAHAVEGVGVPVTH